MSNDADKEDLTPPRVTQLLAGLDDEETRSWLEDRVEFEFNLEAVTEGRYQYIRDIGAGGMGRVMLARDIELERDVAIKVLEVPIANDDDITVARFIREAKTTAGLVHPGIVPVYDLGHTEDGHHFFIMQVVEGVTLREMLSRAKMEGVDRITHISHFLHLFLRICEAVGYAHHRGIAHLDLKPANIMEGAFGEVMVMDWGVARCIGEQPRATESAAADGHPGEGETHGHRVVGTPGFMAPEQYLGEDHPAGVSADVFALGVVLFTILSGEKPFKGNNLGEIQLAVRTGRRLSVQDAAHEADQKPVPKELAAICEQALQLDPAARYPTALELGNDVKAYIENRAISAFHENVFRRSRRWMRRHRSAGAAILGVSGTGVLALVCLFIHFASVQHYLRDFERQIRYRRAGYLKAVRKNEWQERQLERIPASDAERRTEAQVDVRSTRRRRRATAQQLRASIAALLAAQRRAAQPALCREMRQLWLEEMELAIRAGSVDYVQHSFARMQEERGIVPWWTWEPAEFHRVDRIRSWLKWQGAAPEYALPSGEEESDPEAESEAEPDAGSDADEAPESQDTTDKTDAEGAADGAPPADQE